MPDGLPSASDLVPGPRASGIPDDWHRVAMRLLLLSILVATGGCSWNAAGSTGCRAVLAPSPLPEGLDESSGVAWSRTLPGVIWTHNDGGDPVLYALDPDGGLVARVPFRAPRIWDVEDLAVGDCPEGSCVYLADTGDNQEVRPQIQILRLPETPSLTTGDTLTAEAFPVVLPDGPRDIEALFVLPGGEVYLVSKGRSDPQTLYRYPPPLRPGTVVTLEAVQDLTDRDMPIPAQITGADATSDGKTVVIRSYDALTFYRVEGGVLAPMEGGRVSLRTLEEPQGEAVGFGPDGQLLLTTEAGNFGGVAALRVLQCDEPGGS